VCEHHDGVRCFVSTVTISAPLWALMSALLRRLLPTPQRDVFFVEAISIVVTTAVQA
jgi:hypothetical protein